MNNEHARDRGIMGYCDDDACNDVYCQSKRRHDVYLKHKLDEQFGLTYNMKGERCLQSGNRFLGQRSLRSGTAGGHSSAGTWPLRVWDR